MNDETNPERPLAEEGVAEIRSMLRRWGVYGPTSYGYGFTHIPVDDLTDEEIVEIARRIAEQENNG